MKRCPFLRTTCPPFVDAVSGRLGEDLCYPGPQDWVQGAGDCRAGCPLGGSPSGHSESFEGADGCVVVPD